MAGPLLVAPYLPKASFPSSSPNFSSPTSVPSDVALLSPSFPPLQRGALLPGPDASFFERMKPLGLRNSPNLPSPSPSSLVSSEGLAERRLNAGLSRCADAKCVNAGVSGTVPNSSQIKSDAAPILPPSSWMNIVQNTVAGFVAGPCYDLIMRRGCLDACAGFTVVCCEEWHGCRAMAGDI